mmetsp:Transcript_16713/g.52237  ORF Transcript_16713/g.52237 Transcript_16713/m.52237 type:complete len:210 (+) Transcript_16713:1136-1765(+)
MTSGRNGRSGDFGDRVSAARRRHNGPTIGAAGARETVKDWVTRHSQCTTAATSVGSTNSRRAASLFAPARRSAAARFVSPAMSMLTTRSMSSNIGLSGRRTVADPSRSRCPSPPRLSRPAPHPAASRQSSRSNRRPRARMACAGCSSSNCSISASGSVSWAPSVAWACGSGSDSIVDSVASAATVSARSSAWRYRCESVVFDELEAAAA